mgnify:CR=1 FL=1
MIVYKATNKKNGKIYIGQTVNTLKERNRTRKYGKSIFDYAFRKYGEDGFDWEILEEVDNIDLLNERESYWIEFYNSTDRKIGYNLKGGGNNSYLTDLVKHKIGKAQIGEKNHAYGKKWKDSPASKRIMDINTGIIYESGTQAIALLGLKDDKIYRQCKGLIDINEPYRFRFVDENDNPILTRADDSEYINSPKIQQILKSREIQDKTILCLNDLREYKNYEECGKAYNLSKEAVQGQCLNHHKNLYSIDIDRNKGSNFKFIFKIDYEDWLKIRDIKIDRWKKVKEICNKKIKCLTDNMIFNSITECANYYTNLGYRAISKSTISTHLNKNTVFRYAPQLKFILM